MSNFIRLTDLDGDYSYVNMDLVADIVPLHLHNSEGSILVYPFVFEDDWADLRVKETPDEIKALLEEKEILYIPLDERAYISVGADGKPPFYKNTVCKKPK